MPITKKVHTMPIDIAQPNNKLSFNLLQGNNNLILNLVPQQNGNAITVNQGDTVTTMVIYPKGHKYEKTTGVTLANSILSIDFDDTMVQVYGDIMIIIKIETSPVIAYTFNLSYHVVKNPALQDLDPVNNLPSYAGLKADVDQNKVDIQFNKDGIDQLDKDVSQAQTDILNKADKDLANVGDFGTADDGELLYKKDGTLKGTDIVIDHSTGKIISPYSLEVPPNSLHLGDNVDIHENGGFIESTTQTEKNKYLLVDYENDPVLGTQKPIYYQRLEKNEGTGSPIVIVADDTQQMDKVDKIDYGIPTTESQVQAMYFNFRTAVNNLRMKVVVNSNDVAYYPSKLAWQGREAGFNFGIGVQKMPLEPYFSFLKDYDITFEFLADDEINILGDGTKPYLKVDRNKIVRKNMALEDDVNTALSAENVARGLETLTGDDRFDYNALKNKPGVITGKDNFIQLDDTPGSYLNMANKIIAVNGAADGLEFIDAPDSTQSDTVYFRHAFGVKAMNKTGKTINANTFVFLSPKPNGRYNMAPITRGTKYKGELFGLVEVSVDTDNEGVVNLIDNIQTGVTGVSEGVPAYIGFDSAGFDTISIGQKDDIDTLFGRCGVFGLINDLGEYMATFDCFQVQANYLIDEHHDADIDYHSNMPAVIDKEALFVYLFADITGSGGTLFQQLPLLDDVEEGTQIVIENQSPDPTDKITLQASGSDLIDSSPTFEIKGANHRVILIATHNRWVKLYDSEVNGGGADATQVAQNTAGIQALDTRVQANENEIQRLKTDISTGGLDTYVFRDRGIPTIPTDKQYKAYYIHSLVLQDSTSVLDIPSNVPDGAIFSVENNDRTDYLSLRPPAGETINGNTGLYQCGHDTLNYFVKDGTDFVLAYGGVFPNNYDAMKSTIQTLFPNSLHTLAEVEAQLKDRLHTFREIQNEFNDQLHTLGAIEADMTAKGFRKKGGRIGVQGDQAVPTDISSWAVKDFAANEEFLLPIQNKGNQYIVFSLPTDSASIVGEILINQQTMGFTQHDLVDNELDYKVFISKDPVDTSTTIRFKINYIHGTDVMIEWGLADTKTPAGTDWIYGQIQANQHVVPPIQSQTKYLIFKVPVELTPVIDGAYVATDLEELENTATAADGSFNYRIMATSNKVDLSTLKKVNINYDIQGASTGGIEIDDGMTNKAGIKKINIEGAYLSKVYDDSDEVTLQCVTEFEQQGGVGGGTVHKVYIENPLNSYLDPDTKPGEPNRLKLGITHDYFELAKPPGYLAYLNENHLILGATKEGEIGVHTAAIWFDDIIVGGDSPFIEIDKPNKGLGIQDYTGDDPNVTGGVATLIAFRVAMKGKAPSDGFIEIMLKKTDEGTPTQDGDYLLNANGQPIGLRKQYKSGDDLGVLDAMAIYMAKGLTKFQCILEHSFVDDGVLLEDRTEGASGILIQALGTDYATGDALLQFENDTMQNIEMTKHYNGEDIFNMAWALSYDRADVDINAGSGQTTVDGLHFYNNTNLKVGVANKTIHVHDNGTDMAYFSLGQIFSAEKTYMLRNKDLDIKVTLQDKQNGFRIYMVKWTGLPDKYTTKVIDRNNPDNGAIPETNWVLAGSIFISEDAVSGEHDFQGTLTVPADANNFAVVIVPITEQTPLDLYMKAFEIDVSEPFYGWILEAPELIGEKHLQFDERHAELRCDVGNFAEVRYTLNNVPAGMPMPIGIIKSGKADIEIDHTINQVGGSQLPQFEGAIKFLKEGKAIIETELYVHSEKAHSVLAATSFWYSKVSPDGQTFTKIPLSEYTTQVRGQTKAINKMPRFEISVQPGDRIALFGTTDQADGAFIDTKETNVPMLKTIITFDEITEVEQNVADLMTHADEIVFVKAGKPVANPEDYRLEIDVDTGKTTIKTL